MSAFIVNNETLSAIVAYCMRNNIGRMYGPGQNQCRAVTPVEIGQLLLDENVRSVNHRYKENARAGRFVEPALSLEPIRSEVEILKLCNCVEYQIAEPDDWRATDAFWLLQTIKGIAIGGLPGYREAAWELPEAAEA